MSEDINDLETLVVAGVVAGAAGIWSIFSNFQNSNNNNKKTHKKVQPEFDQAYQYIQQGQYREASFLLSQIIQKCPDHAWSYNYLAWIHAIHNYELDQARHFAYQAIRLANTPLEQALFTDTLAEVYAHRNEIDRAIEESWNFLQLMQQLNQTVLMPVSYCRLAWCYQSKQDFNNAYSFIQKALQTNNLCIADYINIGDIYCAMGFSCIENQLYHQAINHYENAITNYDISISLSKNQNIDSSLSLYKLSATFYSIGVSCYYLETYQDSFLAYQHAHKCYPSSPYPPIYLAMLAARQQNKQSMFQWLEIGIPLIVDNPPLWNAAHIISIIINDIDFETYRDDVLNLLYNYRKISQSDHRRFLHNWHSKQHKPINVNNQNIYGSVGVAVGNVEGSINNSPQASNTAKVL